MLRCRTAKRRSARDQHLRDQRVGHGSGRAICYCNLADMLLAQGDLEQARSWAVRSFEVAQRLGLQQQAAVAQLTLAEVELAADDPAACLALVDVAREVFVRLDVVDMAAYCDDVTEQALARA